MARRTTQESSFRNTRSLHQRVLVLSTTALLFGACGGPDSGSMPVPMDPSDPSMMMPMDPLPQGTIGLTMGPIKTNPGTERTVCYTGKFDISKGMDVVQVVTKQAASH